MKHRNELELLKTELGNIGNRAREEFGSLSAPQLNWKPSAERWSVAQCFDHLIAGNSAYFPIIEALANGKRQIRAIERIPVLPKVWARLLIKSLDPKTTRKLKAPAGFQPAASDLPGTIIEDFVANQNRVAELMAMTRDLDLERIIITSPAASAITYSAMDAFRIVVVHEQRHFQQAQRVKQERLFPK